MKIKFTADSPKNLTVQVTGILHEDLPLTPLFNVKELAPPARSIRIDSVLFLLQEKMGLLLWWSEGNLALPLESRGAFSFNSPLRPPEDWEGVMYVSSFKVDSTKHFYFTLDCEKST
jgi:hypothetical protein